MKQNLISYIVYFSKFNKIEVCTCRVFFLTAQVPQIQEKHIIRTVERIEEEIIEIPKLEYVEEIIERYVFVHRT